MIACLDFQGFRRRRRLRIRHFREPRDADRDPDQSLTASAESRTLHGTAHNSGALQYENFGIVTSDCLLNLRAILQLVFSPSRYRVELVRLVSSGLSSFPSAYRDC